MTPNPESDEAVALGCKCPVLDNNHGRGAYEDSDGPLFWIDPSCPVHARMMSRAESQAMGALAQNSEERPQKGKKG